MCKNQFRFRLGEGLTLTEVNPFYGSSLNKEFELETGQKFFREKLVGGKLTFVKDDFDFINDKPFNHQFRIQIDKLESDGVTYINEWFVGEFTKTDCDFDEDEKTIEVAPLPFDRYKLITDARNKEFDLTELSPDVTQIKIALQPLIQIYSDLSGVVTNVLSGVQFEQPISFRPVFFDDLLTIHKFNLIRTLNFVPGDDTILDPDVSGEYDEDLRSSNNQFQFINIGFADVNFPNQSDDPDGLAESSFIVPISTLTDEDFLSIWSASNGNQFEYIGTSLVNGIPSLGFRALGANSAPSTGVLTHVNGATNTTQLTYSAFNDLGEEVRRRWGLYWQNPPVPFNPRFLFLAPMDGGLGFQLEGVFPDATTLKKPELFSPIGGSVGNFKLFQDTILARVLTTSLTFDGNPTFDIPSEDVVSSHGRYTKVVGLDYDGFLLHDGNQSEFEKYGKFSDDAANYSNQYFTKPIIATVGQMIPLQISEWTEASLWIVYTPALQALQNAGNTFYFSSQSYRLSSLIKSLIQIIDPSLTHEENLAHSEFLYTSNPIRGDIKIPVFTPKTRVLSSSVDKPSFRTTVRFSDIEMFLKDFYNAYWYITGEGNFKIEFVDYFDRGLTYVGQNLNADLTTLLEPKTKKPWSYKDKKYKFEKSQLPEQIKHSWMDEVSQPFRGVPIKMISPYVEQGNLDERNITTITSDIDFIHSQASSISPSGFVFFEALEVDGILEVPFVEIVVDGDTFNLQNGFSAMFWAHLKYWLFDLPSFDVNLNYEDNTATTIKKTKIQDVEYSSIEDPDPMKLLQSSIGIASITKMTINLSSGSIKINLKHVTE